MRLLKLELRKITEDCYYFYPLFEKLHGFKSTTKYYIDTVQAKYYPLIRKLNDSTISYIEEKYKYKIKISYNSYLPIFGGRIMYYIIEPGIKLDIEKEPDFLNYHIIDIAEDFYNYWNSNLPEIIDEYLTTVDE